MWSKIIVEKDKEINDYYVKYIYYIREIGTIQELFVSNEDKVYWSEYEKSFSKFIDYGEIGKKIFYPETREEQELTELITLRMKKESGDFNA